MDIERLKVSLEVFYLRSKGWTRTGIRLLGIALVLLGAYNLLAAPVLQAQPIAPYRELGLVIFRRGAYYLGDMLIMAVGAILTWFV